MSAQLSAAAVAGRDGRLQTGCASLDWWGSGRVVQPDEPGVRGPESAAAEVERAQAVLEVDVQPLAPGRAGLAGGDLHQPGADSVPPQWPGDHGVEDERVNAAVPGHVDEPSQFGTAAGAGLARAVPFRLRLPVVIAGSAAEAVGVQGLGLGAGEVPASLVADHRATVRTARTRWHLISGQAHPATEHPDRHGRGTT